MILRVSGLRGSLFGLSLNRYPGELETNHSTGVKLCRFFRKRNC